MQCLGTLPLPMVWSFRFRGHPMVSMVMAISTSILCAMPWA